MSTVSAIILANIISTLIGVLGAAAIVMIKESWARRATVFLLSFGVGTMLGVVFFDLLPEALEKAGERALPLALAGLLAFFLLEKILRIYHHHEEDVNEPVATHSRAPAALVILGDLVHNALDGVVIAAAFFTSFPVGILTTVAVAAHEIPQEIGDFSVLLHSGMRRGRALAWNLFSGAGSLVGALLVIFFSARVAGLVSALLPLAAGGFLYVASADLIPELHREVRFSHSLAHIFALAVGLAAIIAVGAMIPGV